MAVAARSNVVHLRKAAEVEFPPSQAEIRIFQIWDEIRKRRAPHRSYSKELHAHQVAIQECWFGKPGTILSVFNASTGKLLEQYVRREATDKIPAGVQPMLNYKLPKGAAYQSILGED